MCLAIIGLDAHPRYRLVIAANRDEFHARATAPASWWPEGWLAGRDLAGGGTWLGIRRDGRWALLTNVREPERRDPRAPTRGALVTGVLAAAAKPLDSMQRLAAPADQYNGFNLLAGDEQQAAWLSNRAPGPRALAAGIHGLSNATLDTPWPKVSKTKQSIDAWCAAGEQDTDALFDALGSREAAPDHELPATGLTLERERLVSAPFVLDPDYGTRCSTVVLIGREREVTFEERSFDPRGHEIDVVRERFAMP